MKNKPVIGYTAGVYDMFHAGHLNLLREAKKYCDILIVGVNSDELTFRYKNKYPVIPHSDRIDIVSAIKYVDRVVSSDDVVRVYNGRIDAYELFKPDVFVIGDDHSSDSRWIEVDEYLRQRGSRVQYIPYTKHISSTHLSKKANGRVDD